VDVGLQPPLAALLLLAQLPLPIMSPVDLLGGHRQPTRHLGGLIAAATQPAKHARGLVAAGLLVGCQRLLGLLTMGGGPGQLPAAIPGGLVELAAESVPLGPQLRRGQPLEVWAGGGVERQGLAASPGEGLGQLQVAVRLLPVGQVQLPVPLGFGADDGVQPSLLAGSRQLHIQPVDVLGTGEADQGPAAGQSLGAVAGGGIGQIHPPVALAAATAVQI
jgi:hypothetical protein